MYSAVNTLVAAGMFFGEHPLPAQVQSEADANKVVISAVSEALGFEMTNDDLAKVTIQDVYQRLHSGVDLMPETVEIVDLSMVKTENSLVIVKYEMQRLRVLN